MTRPRTIPLLLVALLLLSSLAPLASAGEAWTKETGSAITAVATDERGDLIFVGTESGMVYCYNSAGSVVWSAQVTTPSGNRPIAALDVGGDRLKVSTLGVPARFEVRDVATGTVHWYNQANTWGALGRVAISQTGEVSGTISAGQAVDLWNADGAHILRTTGTYTDVCLSGEGDWGCTASGTTLNLYDISIPDWDGWIAPVKVSDWWEYQNRVSHTITGSTDGALTNYPVEITVIRGSGTSTGSTVYLPDCRADFADIRFTAADGKTQLPYYLESVNGNTAKFYVKIPSIPKSPGTTTIYTYWANPAATTTTSDPAAVYAVYDDFEDGTINTALWTTYTEANGAVTEASGYLRLYSSGTPPSTARITSTKTFSGRPYYITANASFHDHSGYSYDRIRLPALTPGRELSVVGPSLHLFWNEHLYDLEPTEATPQALEMWWNPATSTRIKYGSDWDETRAHATLPVATSLQIRFETGSATSDFPAGEIRIYEIAVRPYTPNPPTHGAWGPVESIVTPLDTKTLDGTIIDIDAPETGDWVAVSTTTKTYIIEITDSGFGTVYSADRTGTPYAVAIANNGANTIEGRGILADIFRFDSVQTGTYTAGGPVRAVAIAQKNGLYAAAGSDDGKYYLFSKDESSSWYLLHASDSEDPVTAIAMSWRGEIAIIGRADGSVIAFRLTEEEITGSIRVTVFKDNIPYRDATIYVERSDGNGEFGPPLPYITDSYGAVTIPTNWGNRLRITADDETREIIATPTQLEYVIRIKGPVPLRTGAQYSSTYDDLTQRIYLDYDDTRDKTHHVTYKIIRAADNTEVFNQSYTDADLPLHVYYQIPAGWTNTSYRVHLTASGSPSFTNTWSQWVGTAGIAELPGELDNFARMGIALFLILFLAGLFSYYTGPQGAVVVSLFTGALVLWGWLPLPPAVVALAIIWAFLGLLGRTSGET